MNGISAFIERDTRELLLSLYPQTLFAMWRNNEKTTICKPENRLSQDTRSASALNLDFQLPELWEINVCSLSHPVNDSLS